MINKPEKLIGIATYAHWIVNKPRIPNIISILAKLHLSIENRSIKDFNAVFSTFTTQLEYEAKSTTQFKMHSWLNGSNCGSKNQFCDKFIPKK